LSIWIEACAQSSGLDGHQSSGILAEQNIDGGHGRARPGDPNLVRCELAEGDAVQINLAKTVAAQPAAAFATISNITDWPQIINSITSVELLTPGPIRAGTRLREGRIMFGRETTQELEVATIDRPHRLRLFIADPDLHYELDHLVDGIYGGGCRIMLIFRSRPATAAGRGLHPFITPVAEITLRDELERDLSDLASSIAVEGSNRAEEKAETDGG
jgi:hypothetical protein